MNNFFDFIRDDIEIRIESIKIHLDNIGENFFKKLDSIKQDVENRLNIMNSQIETNIANYEKCLEDKESNLMVENIYKCQSYIN